MTALPRPLAEVLPAEPHLPFAQSPLHALAMEDLGLKTEEVTLEAGGSGIGRAAILRRSFPVIGPVAAVLRGPVWHDEPDLAARTAAVAALGAMGVRLIEADRPDPALADAGFGQVVSGGATAWLGTGEADGRPLPFAHPKWRAGLRQACSAGLAIREAPCPGPELDWLLKEEAALRRARRYHSVAAAQTAALARRAPEALSLRVARQGRAIVAAMLFVRHGATATYLLGATTEAGRAACAHHLILAEAAGALARIGVLRIDLGQVDTETNPGLARFKLAAGAQLHRLGGSWLRLPRPMARMTKGWHRAP